MHLIKKKRKGSTHIEYGTNVTSQFGTVIAQGSVDVSSDMKKKGPLLTSKLVVAYNLPLLANKAWRKDRLTFSSKVYDKSTSALRKFSAEM